MPSATVPDQYLSIDTTSYPPSFSSDTTFNNDGLFFKHEIWLSISHQQSFCRKGYKLYSSQCIDMIFQLCDSIFNHVFKENDVFAFIVKMTDRTVFKYLRLLICF